MFEPDRPKNAVYMAPSPNCMGVLLLPPVRKKKAITPNPAVESLNIVYTPSGESNGESLVLTDLSGLNVRFQSVDNFVREEKATR
jgi:hypothetical protein